MFARYKHYHKVLKRNAIDGKNLDTLKEICVPLNAAGELFYGAYKSLNW
ncbi:MAG: hypothetical protein JWR72_3853 [Flavisolibacter sp.]|nr:hypothetical protein [Flavisolibacter sp.]